MRCDLDFKAMSMSRKSLAPLPRVGTVGPSIDAVKISVKIECHNHHADTEN